MDIKIVFEILVLTILALSAISDIKKFHINNIYPFAVIITYCFYSLFFKNISLSYFSIHILFSIIILLSGFVLKYFNIWGAGDAKLFASIFLWITIDNFLYFLIITALSMGLLSITYCLLYYYKNNYKNLHFNKIRKLKIPCALSFFIGTLFTFLFN